MPEEFRFKDYARNKSPASLEGRKFQRHYLNVAGASFRQDAVETFFRAAESCELEGFQYGVQLRSEPHNPHDSNAIAVDGFWEAPGLMRSRQKSIQLGYVPADLAKSLRARRKDNSRVIAFLRSGWIGDDGGVIVDLTILETVD